ncbi:hypothetical protein D3C71_2047370 [compost metagenome]
MVATGAIFTVAGRTGSEPITSRRVDSRSSARLALAELTRITPRRGAMAAKIIERRMNARGKKAWMISSLIWSRSFL